MGNKIQRPSANAKYQNIFNVYKRNIPTHVVGNEHFLAPCPKYPLLAKLRLLERTQGLVSPD